MGRIGIVFILLVEVMYTSLVGVQTVYSTMFVVGIINNDRIWTIFLLASTIYPGLNMHLVLFEDPEDVVLVIWYDRLTAARRTYHLSFRRRYHSIIW